MHWIKKLSVDLILDAGANEGQFVGWMRQRGYAGKIISFEPQAIAYGKCKNRWEADENWEGVHAALGEAPGKTEMHISGNSVSSSILPMLDAHTNALPESKIVTTESIRIVRLDQQMKELGVNSKSIFLKVDTQGFESSVLRSADGLLENIAIIELELSLTQLYDGQDMLPDVWKLVEEMGYSPIWVEQGFLDKKEKRLLQVDGLFVNSKLLEN